MVTKSSKITDIVFDDLYLCFSLLILSTPRSYFFFFFLPNKSPRLVKSFLMMMPMP